jgi:ribosomal protein L12E/L44/L45/RPP1/RPP2
LQSDDADDPGVFFEFGSTAMGKQKLRGLTHTVGVNVDDDGRMFWFIAQLENGAVREIETSADRFDSVAAARISGFAEMRRRQQRSVRRAGVPSAPSVYAAQAVAG